VHGLEALSAIFFFFLFRFFEADPGDAAEG